MSELQQILLPSVGDHGARDGEGTELQVGTVSALTMDKVTTISPHNRRTKHTDHAPECHVGASRCIVLKINDPTPPLHAGRDAADCYEKSWEFGNQAGAAGGFKLAFNYLKAKRCR